MVPRNGVSVIVRDCLGRIPFMLQNYGADPKWILGGGGIEKEDKGPKAAAVREFHEEFGIWFRECELQLVATMVQLVKIEDKWEEGELHLFTSLATLDRFQPVKNVEAKETRLFSIGEIFTQPDKFGLAYRRMVLRYLRCVDGIDPMPMVGNNGNRPRLRDAVEYKPFGLRA